MRCWKRRRLWGESFNSHRVCGGRGVFTRGIDSAGGGGGGGSLSAMNSVSKRVEHYDEYTPFDCAKEVLRQTERHLEEQQRLTGAADQRASAFAAVQVVLIGLMLSNSIAPSVDWSKIVVVLLSVISIALALYSARPTRIFGSGSTGVALEAYRATQMQGYLISTLIERNDRNIVHNDRVLKGSAKIFRISLLIALGSVVLLISDWLDLSQYVCEQQGENT